ENPSGASDCNEPSIHKLNQVRQVRPEEEKLWECTEAPSQQSGGQEPPVGGDPFVQSEVDSGNAQEADQHRRDVGQKRQEPLLNRRRFQKDLLEWATLQKRGRFW